MELSWAETGRIGNTRLATMHQQVKVAMRPLKYPFVDRARSAKLSLKGRRSPLINVFCRETMFSTVSCS